MSALELMQLPGGVLTGGNFPGERVAPFSLGKTAMTVAAYANCVSAGACSAPNTGDSCNWNTGRTDHPVNCADWNQAQTFCAWIGRRLPTSQEREWAATGGDGRGYPWGNEEPGARAVGTSGNATTPSRIAPTLLTSQSTSPVSSTTVVRRCYSRCLIGRGLPMTARRLRLAGHLAAVLALALLLLPARALAQAQKKLAVLQFVVGKGVSVERETFSSRLQNAAKKAAPSLFVMTQANIVAMVEAQGKTLEACEGECAVQTGRLIGADFIVTGRITKPGKELSLSIQLYDSQKGDLLDGEDVDAVDEAELLKKTVAAAPRLFAPLVRLVSHLSAAIGEREATGRISGTAKDLDLRGEDEAVVSFDTTPPGAVVIVDGAMKCKDTPCSKAVAAGDHEVRLEKEGYEPAVESLKAKKGARLSVRLLRSTALLAVETTPAGLSITIDDKPAGRSPLAAHDVAPGVHKVVVDDPCWVLDGESIALKKGDEKTVRIAPQPRAAGLKLRAEDEKGNDLEGTASVDGRDVGAVPGTFKISLCSQRVEVRTASRETWSQAVADLKLVEGQSTTAKAVVRVAAPQAAVARPTSAAAAAAGQVGSVLPATKVLTAPRLASAPAGTEAPDASVKPAVPAGAAPSVEKPASSHWVGKLALAAGVVAIGVGGYLTIKVRSAQSALENGNLGSRAAADNDLSAVQGAGLANGLVISGAVLIVGGIAAWVAGAP
jgi:hypothetical protein